LDAAGIPSRSPRPDDAEAAPAIRREFPQALIVALTDEDSALALALAIGVRSYVRKKSRATEAGSAPKR
jgi:DNA-binding NarL/FixJ family response regulator